MSMDATVDAVTDECVRLKGDGWGTATFSYREAFFPEGETIDWAKYGFSRPKGAYIVAVLPDGGLFGILEVPELSNQSH